MDSQQTDQRKNSIPLETAQKWAKRWKRKEGHYDKHHHLSAFWIPKADLLETLIEGIDGIRAYIGIDDNHEPKLMIVGTKWDEATKTYVDLITTLNSPVGRVNDEIFDFTKPCPTTCDANSPLMV